MTLERRIGSFVAAVAALSLVSGCEKKESAPPAAPAQTQQPAAQQPAAQPAAEAVAPEVMKEAQDLFGTRCMPCHGPTGAGDGPASAGLTPKPRNFHDKEWQASVTDDHIEKIIQYGGAAVAKSPAMPPNPDLMDKPVVKGLRAHIRNLGKQ